MAKQEEIRVGLGKLRMSARPDPQGINHPSFLSPDDVETIRQYLHDNDVVIKVDRELPINPCEKCELNLSRECNNVCMERTQYEIEVKMLKAGYVAVEPLIKEG